MTTSNILKWFFILTFLFIISLGMWGRVWAATYYVDATGGNDASADPTNIATPWQTIAKVNDYAEVTEFVSGDSILFKRGEVWTGDETLGNDGSAINWSDSANVNGLTIADYGAGAKPLFDGDVQQPINIDGGVDGVFTLSNLTIENIDVSGQDWSADKYANVNILRVSGVVIDGVDGNGHYNYGGINKGKNAINLGSSGNSCSGTIEIKNCTLYNWGPSVIPSGGSAIDYIAIVVQYMTSGTLSIHDCTIYDIEADGVQLYLNTIVTTLYDSDIYNCGENSVDIKGTSNVTVRDCNLYREGGFTGVGGSGTEAYIVVIHANNATVANDNCVYDCTIGPTDRYCMYLYGDTGVEENDGSEIYTNIFDSCNIGVYFRQDELTNLNFHNNVFDGVTAQFIDDATESGSSGSIVNNTFVDTDGMTADYAIEIEWTCGYLDYKNNIIRVTDDDTKMLERDYGHSTIAYNCWYNSGAEAVWVEEWVAGAVSYGSGDQAAWIAAGHAGELFANPLLIDLSSNLRSGNGSPCSSAGTDLGDGSLYLDPDGNNQDEWGTGWDIGAYVCKPEASQISTSGMN